MGLDSSVDELTSVVVRVSGLLLPEQDAQAAVSKLAQVANRLIESAVGAGVSLLDDGASPRCTSWARPSNWGGLWRGAVRIAE